MRVSNRLTNLDQDLDETGEIPAIHAILGHSNDLTEVPSLDQTHGAEWSAVVIKAQVVHRGDGWVIQLSRYLNLFQETRL